MPTTRAFPGGQAFLAGRPVARIGFGAMQLGERPGREPLDEDAAIALLHRAVELGITLFDTAEFYGQGRSNRLLSKAFAPFDDVVIATKVGAVDVDAPVPLAAAQKPRELRASLEQNLRSLGVDRVDVVNLRRADVPPGILATGDQIVDLDDQLDELVAMRAEGKLGGIGLSHVSLDQVRRALPAGIVCVQNHYSVLDREHEDLLGFCAAHDIAWVPYFPLGSAFDRLPSVADQPVVIDAARAAGVTPAQVGLAWLLQHAPNIHIIAGTSSVDHLEQNAAVGEIELDAEVVRALDALAG